MHIGKLDARGNFHPLNTVGGISYSGPMYTLINRPSTTDKPRIVYQLTGGLLYLGKIDDNGRFIRNEFMATYPFPFNNYI